MHQGKLVCSQLMAFLPLSTFRRCMATHRSVHKVKDFSCLDQFLAMAFAQLTYRESLRDIEPGAFYLVDRGDMDFARLYAIHHAQGFFVTRTKTNTQFKRRYSNSLLRSNTPVFCDQIGVLTVFYSSKDDPAALRRVVVRDDTCKRIKAFLGTSKNTVKSQKWIAVCTCVLIAVVKKHLHLPLSLYETLQILSLSMFETSPINQLLTHPQPIQRRISSFNSSCSSEKRWDTTGPASLPNPQIAAFTNFGATYNRGGCCNFWVVSIVDLRLNKGCSWAGCPCFAGDGQGRARCTGHGGRAPESARVIRL